MTVVVVYDGTKLNYSEQFTIFYNNEIKAVKFYREKVMGFFYILDEPLKIGTRYCSGDFWIQKFEVVE